MKKHLVFLLVILASSVLRANPLEKITPLHKKIGQMIMLGFKGTVSADPGVQLLVDHITNGRIGGVIFMKTNIVHSNQVKNLTSYIHAIKAPEKLLLAIDMEGGRVQRLDPKKNFPPILSAKKFALLDTPDAIAEAEKLALLVAEHGFNLNLAPVVDLDGEPPCSVIGGLERSFSPDIETVIRCAQLVIDAHRKHAVLTTLKHYPGHGYAQGDTHDGMVDVTLTAQPQELEPFNRLIEQNTVDAIMTAHIINRAVDPLFPATLSRTILTNQLRSLAHYNGVIITDELRMGAIKDHYSLRDTVIHAIEAGSDILLFTNDDGFLESTDSFPLKIAAIVEEALITGELSEDLIDQAYERILRMKQKLAVISFVPIP